MKIDMNQTKFDRFICHQMKVDMIQRDVIRFNKAKTRTIRKQWYKSIKAEPIHDDMIH